MKWMSKTRVFAVIGSAAVLLQAGCVVCRPSVNEPVNVGSPGKNPGKIFCSVLVGPRVAREANEGRFVSFGEGLRAVPYLGYIPKIGHAYTAVLKQETSYEYEHERLLSSVARDKALMKTLDVVARNKIVPEQQVATAWKDVLRQDYVSFMAYQGAFQQDYIDSDTYRKGLQQLVRHFIISVNKSPSIDPYNTGLLSVTIQSSEDCDKALRRGLAKTLAKYEYPDVELAEATYRAGLISKSDRNVLQQAAWLRLQQCVAEWSARSMLCSGTESKRQMQAVTQKLERLEPGIEAIKKRALKAVK